MQAFFMSDLGMRYYRPWVVVLHGGHWPGAEGWLEPNGHMAE